jgi:endoglucanase
MCPRPAAVAAVFALLCPVLAQAADSDVKVSSIGYLPSRAKRASVTAAGTQFNLVREADKSVAYTGTLGAAKNDPDTGQSVAVADFGQVTESGNFYLDVPGVGRSVTFPIGPSVYRDAFVATMLGFYGWRCNTAVSFDFGGQTFSHEACHMDDAHTDYIGSPGQRDGRKGWHDAGDYGKYTVNAGITVGILLAAWEEYASVIKTYAWPIPETGGALPDFLAEVRWELEWVLKMQYSATDGRVSHKLTSLTFDAPSDGATGTDQWVVPEKDLQTRYFVPWGSAATADFVAMLAKASRIYRPYDAAFADQCLAAAKVSYAYLQANTANQSVTDPTTTGGYGTTDSDDRLWAAAEMWETTGDAAALTDFEARAAKFATGTSSYVDSDFDWGNVKNLGMYVYLQSQRSGRTAATVTAIQKALTTAADTLVTQHNGSGYGRAISGKAGNYYWGSNGSVARTCMLLQVANRLAPKADYLDTCVDQIGWIFGRNYYNRSQVTGIGINPPLHPHHRPSRADGIDAPWPGLLVGGGNNTSTQSGGNKNGATNWIDDVEAYELNEVAINWNAPLVYALASFLDARTGSGGSDAAVPLGDASGAGGGAGGSSGSAAGGAGGASTRGSGGRDAGGSAGGGAGGGAGNASGGSAGGTSGSGLGGLASGGAGGGVSGGEGGGQTGALPGAGGASTGGSSGTGGGEGGGGGGQGNAGPAAKSSAGCGCGIGARPQAPLWLLLLPTVVAGLSLRRRGRR